MTISANESCKAKSVSVTDIEIIVDLQDRRTISVPIGWYPRLSHATSRERADFRFVGDNEGIHWPAIDEDISVEGLLSGRPSGESTASFAKWLATRSLQKISMGKKLADENVLKKTSV